MPIRRLRFWLPVISLAMLGGSLAVLAWSLLAPCQVNVSAAVPAPRPGPATSAAGYPLAGRPNRLTPESFQPLFARRFQAPLYDPPPKTPAPVVKQVAPPPPVKLLATMPEPGGGHAMFSDPKGAVVVRAVGDRITGGSSPAEIVEIAGDHVVLRYDQRLITLKLGKE